MSANSRIEWTDHTWNPVTGCTKVSPGCDNCYAERFAERWRGVEGHPFENGFDVTLHHERLNQPLHWQKPRRVFVNSMSDLFHDAIPDEYIARVVGTIGAAERHTFQVLTKRHARMRALFNSDEFVRAVQKHWWATWFMLLDTPGSPAPECRHDPIPPLRIDNRRKRALVWESGRCGMPLGSQDLPWPIPNLWLGVSVEDQHWADIRVPALQETPAAVRFLSCEPMLGPINLDLLTMRARDAELYTRADYLAWVICGAESGPGRRPFDKDWARSLRDQCQAAKVAYFYKQGSALRSGQDRVLDGRTHDDFPALAQVMHTVDDGSRA